MTPLTVTMAGPPWELQGRRKVVGVQIILRAALAAGLDVRAERRKRP